MRISLSRKTLLYRSFPFAFWAAAVFCLSLFLPADLHAQKLPEKLTYQLSWTGIPIGTATQEITTDGRMRHIVSTARSNDWLSVFFPVNDHIEAYLSEAGAPFPGLSRRYRMLMREGKHRRDVEAFFDQRKGVAHYIDNLSGEKVNVTIAPDTYDIYSCFYFVRYLPLQVGKPVWVNVFYGKKMEKIEVLVLKKERLKTVFGRINTIVIQPLVKPRGIFEGKGSVQIWLTDDDRRIPVKAKTKVTVGSVTATLTGSTN